MRSWTPVPAKANTGPGVHWGEATRLRPARRGSGRCAGDPRVPFPGGAHEPARALPRCRQGAAPRRGAGRQVRVVRGPAADGCVLPWMSSAPMWSWPRPSPGSSPPGTAGRTSAEPGRSPPRSVPSRPHRRQGQTRNLHHRVHTVKLPWLYRDYEPLHPAGPSTEEAPEERKRKRRAAVAGANSRFAARTLTAGCRPVSCRHSCGFSAPSIGLMPEASGAEKGSEWVFRFLARLAPSSRKTRSDPFFCPRQAPESPTGQEATDRGSYRSRPARPAGLVTLLSR